MVLIATKAGFTISDAVFESLLGLNDFSNMIDQPKMYWHIALYKLDYR